MEAINTSEPKAECGWCKLYTKAGVLVTLPVTEKTLDYARMIANVDAMLAAGFSVLAPGLEQGEEKEMVRWVCKGEIEQDGGKRVTPYVMLYIDHEKLKFAFLKVYLNTPEEVAAFEYASGFTLERMPVYVGDNRPERGKSSAVDKFILEAKKPFGVVFGTNPRYSKADADAAKAHVPPKPYGIPAKIFHRWEDQDPKAVAAADAGGSKASGAAETTPTQTGSTAGTGSKPAIPTNMVEMLARLDKWEGELIAAGSCKKGDVLAFLCHWVESKKVIVTGAVLNSLHPKDWPAEAIPLIVEQLKTWGPGKAKTKAA